MRRNGGDFVPDELEPSVSIPPHPRVPSGPTSVASHAPAPAPGLGSRGAAPTRPDAGPGRAAERVRNHSLGRTLRRALLRELAVPTALALLGLSALVLAKDLLGFSDLVVNRGLGAGVVGRIALYELVPIVARLVPFAALIGALVALGRLREDAEIVALESCGVSVRSLAGPILGFGAALALLAGAGTWVLAPRAERALSEDLARAIAQNPGAALRSGVAQSFGERRLEAREISPAGDVLRGVLLWMPDVGETIFAREALLAPTGGGGVRLVLRDGVVLLAPREGPQELRFATLNATLEQDVAELLRTAADPLAAEAARALRAIAAGADPGAARAARSELARRASLPAAAVAFALLALPLALGGARFSRASGASYGLAATVVYYGLVQLGSGLARSQALPPELAAWLPNGAVLVVAAVLLVRLGRRGAGHERGSAPGRGAGAGSEPRPRARALERAVAARFLQLALLSCAALFLAYLVIDVLERLQWLARYDATPLEALRFYAARAPLLASRVLPMALLAAGALTASTLARDGELVAMESLGISARRGLAPILVLALVAAPAYHALSDGVVPRTNRRADELKEREIKGASQDDRSIWYRDGERLVRAGTLDPDVGEARDLTLWQLDAGGLPTGRIDATAARHVAGGVWELESPVRVAIGPDGLRRVPAPTRVDLGRAEPEMMDSMHLGARALAREIAAAESRGYDVTSLRVDLAVRLAAPVACLLLPLLGLLVAGHGPPFPRPALALLVSAALGVAYLLASALAAALGYGKSLAPAAAAALPLALLAAFALLLALRRRA